MNEKELTEFAMKTFIETVCETLSHMEPAERLRAFSEIFAQFCPHCGKEIDGVCYCMRDD